MNARTQLEQWPIARVLPYARNARVCPEQAIAKVAGSIREFGFRNPILVDEAGVIIAGHTRLAAAQRLELDTVPVIICDGLTPAQVKALRLADNRTGQETSWDDEMLAIELEELLGLNVDLELTGFDSDEIAELFAVTTEGRTDEDEPPEIPEGKEEPVPMAARGAGVVIVLYPDDDEPHVTQVGDRTLYGELVFDFFTAALIDLDDPSGFTVHGEDDGEDRDLETPIDPADYGKRLIVAAVA